ncbi:MAG: hypothetical protein WKG01_11610 [Kofleriaceae bacterium]
MPAAIVLIVTQPPLDGGRRNAELERVWATRIVLAAGARRVSVVSRDGLVTMKRIAGRPQDLADLAKLEGLDDES